MSNKSRSFSVFAVALFSLVLCHDPTTASAAVADPSLRWMPSLSPGVTGYVVYLGNQSGFYGAGAAVAEVDIGLDFSVENGVARYPLSDLISASAWVVMTAYDQEGMESEGSNELFKEAPGACSADVDCDDGDACNGAESCSGGLCTSGAPLVCGTSGPCEVAACDALVGCITNPAVDGLLCDDRDPETTADVCGAGTCRGEVSSDVTSEPFYFDDFEASAAGSDPVGWTDTAAGSFDQFSDDFYVAAMTDGNHVLQTTSGETNLHSHLMDGGSSGWSDYEFSGRMRIDTSSAGIGVTLYSGFPYSDTYYRLRRYGSGSFHFAPHPDGSATCVGVTNTNVRPDANRWYEFRFRAFSEDGGTRVQAKVWDAAGTEPANWQADCLDPMASALTRGAPGIWSMKSGTKSWDNLGVSYVSNATEPAPDPQPEPECVTAADCGDGDACNGAESCVSGSCTAGDPLACTGSQQCSFATCDPALGCVIEFRPDGQSCDDENLCTGEDVCQTGVCTAGPAQSCPTSNQCQAGVCDPLVGCGFENLLDGSQCDDGDASTGNDVCQIGRCVGEPVVVPEPVPAPAPEPTPEPAPAPEPELPSGVLSEDFEQYAQGEDPTGWFDTGASNSLDEDQAAFEVMELADGNRVFGTNSTAANIHSHYVDDASANWAEYEYRGRMRIASASGGIGVTLYSDFPNSDSYYRLRKYGTGSFHLAPHPDDVVSCVGSTDTGVRPKSQTWYHFSFQASAEADGTRVRARVWAAGEAEPEFWQIDCLTTGFGTFYAGSPGVWSMGAGAKYWDDLETFDASGAEPPVPVEAPPGGSESDVFYFEDFQTYSSGADPDGWFDTGAKNSLVEDAKLFAVIEQSDGNLALATSSRATNIHSHLLRSGNESLSDYEFSGRMQITNRRGGIGVTLYSDYPNSDAYYRLRSFGGGTFHIAGHANGAGTCSGRSDSGVTPVAKAWYRFRFQAMGAGSATRLRAKVWPESAGEPASWQIDCAFEASVALQAGRPGIWSMKRGQKLWDDLEVREIPFE